LTSLHERGARATLESIVGTESSEG
jgi:hypothetical protein